MKNDCQICIKVISKNGVSPLHFTLPQKNPNIRFTIDPKATDYDWLVVYDDLPRARKERLPRSIIQTNCPQNRTVLCTYEPSSVKFYGDDYVKQFGMVLTSHAPNLLTHPNRRNFPPVGVWAYGGAQEIQAHPTPPLKTREISLFHTDKKQRHTLHARRFEFMNAMIIGLGDKIDVYGKNSRPVRHKAEGLDDYCYHIAVENHIGKHHWTEKLSDSFLGYSLPFYVGCTNAADYFPPRSFIPLDLRDHKKALQTIREAIANNEYEKRLPAICEARRRVIEDYNFGNMLAHHLGEKDISETGHGILYSRHSMMSQSLPHFLRYAKKQLQRQQENRIYWKNY